MKNTFKNILLLSALSIFAVGCMDDDQSYPDPNKPEVNVVNQSITIDEAGDAAIINLTVSRAIGAPIDLVLTPVSGDAVVLDYNVSGNGTFNSPDDGVGPTPSFDIVIPAGQTSHEIPINALIDLDFSASESVVFELRSTGSGQSFVNPSTSTITVNINNAFNSSFGALLEWEGDVTYSYINEDNEEDMLTEGLCDHVDFDLFLNPVGYVAGSAACPEFNYAFGELADGDYQVFVDLYSVDPSEIPLASFAIPFKLTLGKVGVISTTLEYNVFNSDSPVSAPAGLNDGLFLAATVNVTGGNYTIADAEGNVVLTE
jgi:hypothetical protein